MKSSVIVIRFVLSDTVSPFAAIAYIDIRVAGALGIIATSSNMSPIHVYVYAVCSVPCPNFIVIGFVYVYVGRFIFRTVSVLVMCMSAPLSAIAVFCIIFVMRDLVNTEFCCCVFVLSSVMFAVVVCCCCGCW